MEIKTIDYYPKYQSAIDLMMERIQSEFAEAITSVHSTVIKDVYLENNQKFWIALDKENVAGTIGVKLFAPGKAEIKRMMVDPSYRGSVANTANLLMEQAILWCQKNAVRDLYLGTMKQFIAAQKFYEKTGFTSISEEALPSEYVINPMDTLFYHQRL